MNKKKIGIIIAVVVILLDQLTKILIINKQLTIIPNLLEFTYTENTGVAFGIANSKLFMIILASIIILGIICKFIKERETQLDKNIILSLYLILAGGISNLIDRVFRGYVVDFIDINILNFPNFNIADICITLGIFALIFIVIKSLFESENTGDDKIKFNKLIPELSVTNLEKSLEFYKTIGFKIEYERKENKFVFLSLGEIQFMLQEITGDDKWEVAPLVYPFGNGINFQLEVEDATVVYDKLKNNNYKIIFDMEENWYRQDNKLLGNKEFLVQDPDGYLLRISEDLGEKEI